MKKGPTPYLFAFLLTAAVFLPGVGWGQYVVDFEGPGETKTAYASGTVTLSGLNWNLTEVLIGTSAADWKNGARSARLRGHETSSMTMIESKPNGLGAISFQYRRYGTDAQVDWRVEFSTDNGLVWTQIGSDFTASATDDVQTFSETVNIPGNIRIRIKRATETGTDNRRLNIDDITITDYFQVCGNESFDNLNAPTGSYSSGSFWGNDNISWSYMEVRTVTDEDYFITNPSAGFRDSGARFMEASVTGGIGSLEYKVRSYFTGGSASNRTIRVLVNNIEVDLFTLPAMETVYTREINNINISGNFSLRFESIGSRQILIDDITWTCFDEICNAPTTHASNLSAASITDISANISFTKGSGTYSLVIVRAGAAVIDIPSDGTSYMANQAFGDGNDLGNDSYVVFAGPTESFTLSGLLGGTTYHVKIFPFNCSGGNEVYYSENDPASFSFTTRPSLPTGLTVTCTDATSATITWNAPSGNYDGVIIGMRQDTNYPHVLSANPADIFADSEFGSGFIYGTTDPRSFVVYKGTENSVTVTGLTAGEDYRIQAYTFQGSNWSIGQHTTSINNLGVPDISGLNATALSESVALGWNNPSSGCFDEVIIVVHTASITGTPSGTYISSSLNYTDGGNPGFPGGGVVVFNGTSQPQTVFGLTNGTEYFFRIFVRRGADWSEGVEISATPNDFTVLESGDLAIIAVNTQYLSSGSADEVCFISFKDIEPGTAIDFTDNGYERLYEGLWGNTEGTIRMTYNGTSPLGAGTPICFQGNGYSSSSFSVIKCGQNDNANWSITSLNGNKEFNLNQNDQIWILQNGIWNPGNLNSHNASYSGNVVWGWTATGWESAPDYTPGTDGSTLPPGTECYHTDVEGVLHPDKVKYTGPLTSASQGEWIARINDLSNWTSYSSNTAYNEVSLTNYSGECISFPISPGGFSAGKWSGGIDEDWYNCRNWDNLQVPDETVDVTIDNISNYPEINTGTAKTRNILIQAGANINLTDVSAALEVYGNWTNQSVFDPGAGTIIFKGSSGQNITSPNDFRFNYLTINNSGANIQLGSDLNVSHIFTMNQGNILTNGHLVTLGTSVTQTGELNYFSGSIFGKLKRHLSTDPPASGVLFPLGASIVTDIENNVYTPHHLPVLIEYPIVNPTTGGSLSALFVPESMGEVPENITILGSCDFLVSSVSYQGFWRFEADELSGGEYDITLFPNGYIGIYDLCQLTALKRTDNDPWTEEGTHVEPDGTIIDPIIKRTGITSGFSDWGIGGGINNPLPIELLSFTAKYQDGKVLLKWATGSEINNDFFTLERSHDAVNAEAIGFVEGAGNSSQTLHYNFVDHDPLPGISYYRLKQTDYDGSFEYSQWVAVQVDGLGGRLQATAINQPEGLMLRIFAPTERTLQLQLADIYGRIVFSEQLSPGSPGQIETFVPMPQTARSVLLYRVTDGLDVVTGKVIR